MLTHTFERGVLVLTLDDEPKAGATAWHGLATHISDLVHVHTPAPVVILLSGGAAPSLVTVMRFCGPTICAANSVS